MLIDDKLNIKLLDFGLACKGQTKDLNNWVGTPSYMAPEIHEQRQYNAKEIDIFSLGVIIFSIVVGRFPFEKATMDNYYYSLIKREMVEEFFSGSRSAHLSPEFKELMMKMFAYDGSKRPTISEIKNHPWMCINSIKVEIEIPKHKFNKS